MKRILLVALAVLALTASAAQAAAKPVKYAGKTKEGTKISFVVAKGWVDQIQTSVPTSCVSAQGGSTPRATIDWWQPPYKFKLGREAKVTVEEPYPTRTYGIKTRKSGRSVKGNITLSYSKIDYTWSTSWRILTCYGTASFSVKQR